MESNASPPTDAADRPEGGRAELRSLLHLRDRVEAAAREIERLRTENAALAQRVLELQDDRHRAPSFAFGEGEDPEALKARVQGFIDTIDGLLRAESTAPAAEQTGKAAADDR